MVFGPLYVNELGRTIIAAYLLAERPRKNTLKDFQNILNNQPCLVKRYFWSN